MFNKICDLWRSVNARVFTGALALSAVLLPAFAHAEGSGSNTITLDSAVSGIDIASGLSSVGEKVAQCLCLGIGLAGAVWAITLCWRKIRSVVR